MPQIAGSVALASAKKTAERQIVDECRQRTVPVPCSERPRPECLSTQVLHEAGLDVQWLLPRS